MTRAVLEAFLPHSLAGFEEEFALFAMSGGTHDVRERGGSLKSWDQGLDTTLVAGMFFQVLVEAEHLPASTAERVSFVRKQAKNAAGSARPRPHRRGRHRLSLPATLSWKPCAESWPGCPWSPPDAGS